MIERETCPCGTHRMRPSVDLSAVPCPAGCQRKLAGRKDSEPVLLVPLAATLAQHGRCHACSTVWWHDGHRWTAVGPEGLDTLRMVGLLR